MRYHERMVMLSVIDGLWKDHLLSMDHLKEGIGLRGYAQRDPLVEYKRESYDMFEAMMLKFQEDTVRFLFRMQILGPDGQPVDAAPRINRTVPAAPPVASAAHPLTLDAEPREISIHTRQPSTTIDALEKEFRRKKERELEAASRSGRTTRASRRSGGRARRWDATIPARAGAGRSTKSATGRGSSDASHPGSPQRRRPAAGAPGSPPLRNDHSLVQVSRRHSARSERLWLSEREVDCYLFSGFTGAGFEPPTAHGFRGGR